MCVITNVSVDPGCTRVKKVIAKCQIFSVCEFTAATIDLPSGAVLSLCIFGSK